VFRQLLAQRFPSGASSTAEARADFYAKLHQAVRAHYKNPRSPAYLTDYAALDRAIEAFEASSQGTARAAQPSHSALSFRERLAYRIGDIGEHLKFKYGAIAAGVSLISDFITPIVDFTVPLLVGSAVVGLLLMAFAGWAGKAKEQLKTVSYFCGATFVFCLGLLMLQTVVPGAKANGAVAEVIPGMGAFQNLVMASLGRIEAQTKRVGDILEESAKQDEADRAEMERQMQEYASQQQEELNAKKDRIAMAGYSLDATGLLNAFKDNYSYKYDFDEFKVEPTEGAIVAMLPALTKRDEIYRVLAYVESKKDDYAFMRSLYQRFVADKEMVFAAYTNSGAQGVLCNEKSYSLVVNRVAWEQACQLSGLPFATAYYLYYYDAYGSVDSDGPSSKLNLKPTLFMINAAEELPLASRGGKLLFDQFEDCKYYEGELDYFFFFAGWVSIQTANRADTRPFDVEDQTLPADQCRSADVIARKVPQCRARVIMASSCDLSNRTVIKVLP